MEYEVQSARITTTGRLPDRFLNCQAQTSKDLSRSFMGHVYSLVEINSPWFDTAQVGQLIINTFAQSYYHGASTSDIDNFEESLKNVNENLTKITQDGQTSWIGKLNAILAVVVEDSIHVAQTGRCEAYIFRNGKVNHLTYGLAQSPAETHPLKTFSNITSGELKPHDKVLLANPDLFRNIDLDSLRDIITVNSPNAAILQIAKVLKRKKAKGINLIILDFLTKEEASRQTADNLPDMIQLDKPLESYWAYVEKFWQQILQPSLKFIGFSFKKLYQMVVVLSQIVTALSRKYYHQIKAKKTQKIVEEKDRFDREFLSGGGRDEGLLKDEEIKYSPELKVHYYEQQNAAHPNIILLYLSKILDQILSFGLKLWSYWQNKKTRPYFLIAIAVLFLVILGFVIGSRLHRGQNKMSLLDAQNILKSAEASQSDAKSAILSNDKTKAKTKLYDCLTNIQKIKDFPVVKSDAGTVLEDCQANLDQLTSTTRFSKLAPVFSANKEIKSVFISGDQAIMADASEIFAGNLLNKTVNKVATLPHNNGDFQFGNIVDNNIYLYTSAQKVYDFDLNTNKLVISNIDGSWETANAGFFYTGNLYLLDGIVGQIYRHGLGANGFAGGQTYVNDSSVDIKNSISMAIDGAVYILKSTGDVLKLQKGTSQNFSFQGIPDPQNKIGKAVKIYTDSDAASIYVLDSGAKRILEFDKSGNFTHQYALPDDFNQLTDFAVSAKSKQIYILNAGSLYEIGI